MREIRRFLGDLSAGKNIVLQRRFNLSKSFIALVVLRLLALI